MQDASFQRLIPLVGVMREAPEDVGRNSGQEAVWSVVRCYKFMAIVLCGE